MDNIDCFSGGSTDVHEHTFKLQTAVVRYTGMDGNRCGRLQAWEGLGAEV